MNLESRIKCFTCICNSDPQFGIGNCLFCTVTKYIKALPKQEVSKQESDDNNYEAERLGCFYCLIQQYKKETEQVGNCPSLPLCLDDGKKN